MMKTEDDSPWSLFFDDQAANDYILRLVLDNLPEPLALHTPDGSGGFRFVAVNRAFERFWHVAVDTLFDRPLAETRLIPVARRWIELYRDLGDSDSGEVRRSVDMVTCPAGSGRILAIRSSALRPAPALYGVTIAVEE
jgi:PAS domain-containing protein